MPKLCVVARIVAKPESVPVVRRHLSELLAPTRAEEGCLVYDLFQSESDPTDFTFYEEWTNGAALDVHAASPHIRAVFTALDGHLASPPDVRRYAKIG
jgi:quinol monooxygenase YgiN